MPVDDRLRAGLAAQAHTVQPDVEALLADTVSRHRRRRTARWAGVAALAAAACAALVLAATLNSNPKPVPLPAKSLAPHTCSQPRAGGQCLDDLSPGTYRTTLFQPPLRYTVAGGWRNDEDRPANFVLTRRGDDQNISYLGIYTNVAAASIDCFEMAQAGVAQTPQALVAWFRSVPKLVTSKPVPVTVGGLRGYQLDIDVAKRRDEACTFAGGSAHGTPLIWQDGGLHHVAAADLHVRLLILGWRTGNVTVEITSAKQLYPGLSYAALAQPVIDSLKFAP